MPKSTILKQYFIITFPSSNPVLEQQLGVVARQQRSTMTGDFSLHINIYVKWCHKCTFVMHLTTASGMTEPSEDMNCVTEVLLESNGVLWKTAGQGPITV